MNMNHAAFAAWQKIAETPSGRIAYVEQGDGPVAVFLHGILLNKYLWRHQLAELRSVRRCIALDLLAHGATDITPDQEVSYDAQAAMVEEFLDALNIRQIDLVANDSATGIAQIFAVNHPDRVRTLTLTDGDTHDNLEPAAFKEFLTMATRGELRKALESMLEHKEIFRSDRAMGLAYEQAETVADDTIEAYLRPFVSSPQRLHDLVRFCQKTSDSKRTRHVESRLRMLLVPTLIAWGTDDVFFDVKWADWLATSIPGTRRRVKLTGARLYFPEERYSEFNEELGNHWVMADKNYRPPCIG
jgi:pimeloyl-ACP methyl ester carboxylesterase